MVDNIRALMALKADARNRALRTFLQGLFLDLLVAGAMTTWAIVSKTPDFDWKLLGLAVAKTLVTTAAAYIMRLKLDPSSIPTPLPPTPQPEPADQTIGGHTVVAQTPGYPDHRAG